MATGSIGRARFPLDAALKIKGDTDDTLIGNIGDRLKVTQTGSPIPDESVVAFSVKLDNAGSNSMNVDGSSTPVTFSAGPTTTSEVWYITRIAFKMDDTGSSKYDDFASILGGLTNGLLLQMDVGGTIYNTSLIKTNAELIVGFDSAIRGQSNSFINDINFISASTRFTVPIKLDEADSDKINVVVQDDISGLNIFEVTLFYIREV